MNAKWPSKTPHFPVLASEEEVGVVQCGGGGGGGGIQLQSVDVLLTMPSPLHATLWMVECKIFWDTNL